MEKLKDKTFTLIFKNKCGKSKDDLIDFKEWGTCCVEVSSLYKKTNEEGQRWYWTPNNEEYCKDFQSYEFKLIYDKDNKVWRVVVWIPETNNEVSYSYGVGDDPLNYYNCKLELDYGGVYVRDDITCSAVKGSM